MDVGVGTDGDELPSGELVCAPTVCERIHGSADEPPCSCAPRDGFAPRGLGAAGYSFGHYLSAHGTVHLGDIDTRTAAISIMEAGNQIEATLDR